MRTVKAEEISSHGGVFRKKGGTYSYLKISDSAAKFHGLDFENKVYGVCYNGNMTSVDKGATVEVATHEDMEANRQAEIDWNINVGAKFGDDDLMIPLEEKLKETTKGYIGDKVTEDQITGIGNNVAQMFATMFQDDRIECLHTKEDPLNEGTIITTISIPKADITRGVSTDLTDLLDDDQVNYVVHYKWQEGAELFFSREIIKDFALKDKDALQTLENRLCTILSNCGMEEEHLATVQVTGITQLQG